jgi:Animal haem peroxidase
MRMQIRDELAQRRRRRARRTIKRVRRAVSFAAVSLILADLVRRAVRRAIGGPATTRYVYDPPLAARLYADLCVWIDRTIGWPTLPTPLGLAVLLGERVKLRLENLHDTAAFATLPQPEPQAQGISYLRQRTPDGTFNALDDPTMGAVNTRFGRNVPNEYTWPDPEPLIMAPNPRVISRELFTRDSFVPATSLNMLAAAWIQFMTRDWFSHGTGDISNPWQVQLPPGDDFRQNPMLIPRTIADPTRPPHDSTNPPTHINLQTAWWDASQIYPTDLKLQGSVRTGSGGKLMLVPDAAGELSLPPPLLTQLAAVPGWWLGLGLLLTLFAREHNAICDRLAAEYPSWSDEQLFQMARLINAALLAKIHTVEWSPAIIAHPTSQMALHGNWWGVGGEKLHPLLARISNNEIIRGIPGTPTNQHSAPYSMTEEFVAVYRMHSLIRDDYSFRRASDDASIAQHTFEELTDVKGNQFMEATGLQDLLYSFGTLYPGALQLHNYPRFLQHFTRPDGQIADLASIDILRMREFGVPRYTLFRELLHLRPVRSFEDMTNNSQWAREIREVYEGRLDRVDLMVGMFAEAKPTGFGFSDTAFRIFILMASRRLKSDRFFGQDFRPEVYTPIGMQWVQQSTMSDVLLRHYPGLGESMQGISNAFQPWRGSRA